MINQLTLFIILAVLTSYHTVFADQQYSAHGQANNDRKCTIATLSETQIENNPWNSIRHCFILNSNINQQPIDKFNQIYSSNPTAMKAILQRAAPYLPFIIIELRKRQLPLDFALLPIIESGYDPFAFSYGNAAGIWQLIPATATRFGVTQNRWFDGRRDIQQSTLAALDYIAYLGRLFEEDWLHVLAAYNAGEGSVLRAIARNRQNNISTQFWDLKLPQQTQEFIPRLLAMARLFNRESSYAKIKLNHNQRPTQLTNVDANRQINLQSAANVLALKFNTLITFNPGFNYVITPPTGPHNLLIPNDRTTLFNDKIDDIALSNSLHAPYTVKSGDNLSTIAQQYNTSVEDLMLYNQRSRTIIYPDEELIIPLQATRNDLKIQYTVQPGDSLWKISQDHNISIQDLAQWNNLSANDWVNVGKNLDIWTASNAAVLINSRNSVLRRIIYPVKKGDSLARIGERFNVRVRDIMNWNTFSTVDNIIHPGDNLILYIDVTSQSSYL